MRIGFDAKRLFYNNTGLGNYSRDLVKNFSKYHPSESISLFSPKTKDTAHTEFLDKPFKIITPTNKFLWRYWRMSSEIKKHNIDIFHGLSNELPLGIRSNSSFRSIVTIHDLIFLKYPEFYRPFDRLFYYEKTKRAVRVADRIIAISESTKRDIIDHFNVDDDKISVVYQSCNEFFFNSTHTAEESELNEPYFMYVGSISERKNLKIVIHCLKEITPENRISFYIIGSGKKYKKELKALIHKLDLGNWVKFKGQVTDEELIKLYRNARFSIYPSLYEGFGIPILESQLLGTPVITSNTASMPEVACNQSILIDPYSKKELQDAIEKMSIVKSYIPESDIQILKQKFGAQTTSQQLYQLYKSQI